MSTLIREQALLVALEEMDKGAQEIGGNNAGEFVAVYHGHTLKETLKLRWAWCAAFVSWCYLEACQRLHAPMPIPRTGRVWKIWKHCEARDWLISGKPQRGDLVFWYRGRTFNPDRTYQKAHIGIVVSVEENIVVVIEGNRGRYPAKVRLFEYKADSAWRLGKKFVGYARVPEVSL